MNLLQAKAPHEILIKGNGTTPMRQSLRRDSTIIPRGDSVSVGHLGSCGVSGGVSQVVQVTLS